MLSFAAPWLLLALIAVPVVAGVYIWLQRRATQNTVKFTNLALLGKVANRKRLWRRHVPAVLFLVALAILVVAMARPQSTIRVPREEATVILIIDTSGSMGADDVSPTRLAAAQASAREFLNVIPPKVQVGLVSFSSNVKVMSAPTTDREAVRTSIDSLQPNGGTAIGDAIDVSINLVRRTPAGDPNQPPASTTPKGPKQDSQPPASILLLSDGKQESGKVPALEGAERAKAAGVPVFTVALGTSDGVITQTNPRTGQVLRSRVPPDPETLHAIARATNAKSYQAPTANQLKEVYRNLGSLIGYKNEYADATYIPTTVATLILLLSGSLSLLWFRRLP